MAFDRTQSHTNTPLRARWRARAVCASIRGPWYQQLLPAVRITLVVAVLLLVILTITLPAWVLADRMQAEGDLDSPGSHPGATAFDSLSGSPIGSFVMRPVVGCAGDLAPTAGHDRPADRAAILRWMARSGRLPAPPPVTI